MNRKRATATFVLAYIAITILGTALALAIGAVLHTPPTARPLDNAAYLISERFLPALNLSVWMACSRVYFRGRADSPALSREAIALGAFWLAVALPADLLCFVVVKSPISLSAYDFYVGQFPWIYLIYLAVLVSPLCTVTLAKMKARPGDGSPRRAGP